ncbi:MAG: hypothetical protein RIR76_2954 [Verrucomicrobiota bacterium]
MRTAGELAEPKDVAKNKRTVFVVAGAIGLVVFACGLYFAYSVFFSAEPPAPVAKKSPPPAAAKTPAAAAPAPAPKAPAAPPTTPVAKAKAATETRAQTVAETAARVAAAAPAAPSPAATALPPAPAATPPATPVPAAATASASAGEAATARTTIAKGVTATTTLEQAGADASVEFRTFVANAKISGVFQGTPARAVINGRLARSGETIDAAMGVVFDRIDADRRHIVFRDRTGATVTRRY